MIADEDSTITTTDEAMTPRPTDGKLRGEPYSRQVKARGRLYWALNPNLEQVDELMGLPSGTAKMWKHRRQPDGLDWDEFREALDITDVDRIDMVLGPPSTVAIHDYLVRMGRRLMAIALTALDQSQLYDEDGNKVNKLFTATGKPVRLGIRPTNMSQVVNTINMANKLISHHTSAMEIMHTAQQQQMREQGVMYRTFMAQIEPVIIKTLGPAAWEKVKETLASGALLPKFKGDTVEVEGEEESKDKPVMVEAEYVDADEDEEEGIEGEYVDDEIDPGYGKDEEDEEDEEGAE